MRRTMLATQKVKGYASKYFQKVQALNFDIDDGIQGAHRVKRALSDTWVKRTGSAGSFFKPNKASPCTVTKGK